MNTVIRPAIVDDLGDIATRGKELYNELGYHKYCRYDWVSVHDTCRNIIESGILLVAHDDSELVGFAAAVISPMYFNTAVLNASELFWWVDFHYRALGLGKQLANALEVAARDCGADTVTMVFGEEAAKGRAADIIGRMGYTPVERSFMRRLNDGGI